jgi:hypothetical protein
LLTLPFSIIARVTLPSSTLQLHSSLPQSAPNLDLPLELRNAFVALIGCETRILWKVHEDTNVAHPAASSNVAESPRPATSVFAAALTSPVPSLQLSNKKPSPFATALARPTTPLSSTLPSKSIATPAALATPSSVSPSAVMVKYLFLGQRVDAALEKMKHQNHPRLRLRVLEREARRLLEHICTQQLQMDLDASNCCSSTARPLIIVYGCEGCGKRSLIRSAYAAVEPPVLISELDCSFLLTCADAVQHSLELFFASAARSNSAVLITGVQDLLNTRKFSSAVTTRFVSVLIRLLMERALSNSVRLQSPCVITCLSPEFLDSNLRAFAQLEIGVPSPSLDDRASIIAIHIENMLHPAIRATAAPEFHTGGKFSHVLLLACETATGYRFVSYAFMEICIVA